MTTETVPLKTRYANLLQRYISIMDHWTTVSGGGLVTPAGAVLPNYASSRARALKIMQENLSSFEPDEESYAALRNEFLYSMAGARNSSGNVDWVRDTLKDSAKWL
jgi:hypothetical protein